ncbi:hypothetical protein AX16_010454 [Volvariella volvacea WC 439]|nr:hypothetical protein AX16_010454 [Volvariella volvacea WC 439]
MSSTTPAAPEQPQNASSPSSSTTVTTPATTTTTTSPSSLKPPGAGRLPSLNQLAAKLNTAGAVTAPTSSAPRPRLAAHALRTGSTTSLSTTATNDSTVVNPPSTRSTSPLSTTTSPQQTSSTPTSEVNGSGDALTTEKLEKLNLENSSSNNSTPTSTNNNNAASASAPAQPPPHPEKRRVGYKNIPSLDAITARLVKTRSLSIDGSAKPPEPEYVEDPKTPGVPIKVPEHPLQFTWTFYHDTKTTKYYPPQPGSASGDGTFAAHPAESMHEYEAGLTVIGECSTVEEFCRYFNWLKPPSKLERNSNFHLFKAGIKPMWEDPANANGGKWVLTMRNNPELLDRCWTYVALALVGEELEEGDEICGAVVSLRSKVDRIQVWTRSKDDVERLNSIGKKLVKLLDVSEADGIGFEFQYNTEDRPLPNKFLSIQAIPNSSYRSSFQPAAPSPIGAGGIHPRQYGAGAFGNDAQAAGASPINGGGAFGSFGIYGIGDRRPPAKRG